MASTDTKAMKETPLSVLSRTNLAKYLTERHALAEKTCGDQPESLRGKCTLVLSSDSSFQEALSSMNRFRVSSMPLVRYKSGASRDVGAYDALCFLSNGDLVTTLIEACDKAELNARDDDVLGLMGRMATIGLEIESLPLKQARTKWDGTVIWKSATVTQSLAECLERCLYISPSEKPGDVRLRALPHRFAVMNSDNAIEHIVSQSDIVMYLHTNRDILTPLFTEATVNELGLASTPGIAFVGASTPTIEAFREMERHRVGAVPIVDEATRTLIGTLSESDLTHLRGGASFAALALPVAEFLLHAHKLSVSTPAQQSGGLYNPNTSAFAAALMRHRERLVVSCRPSDTLTDVLTKMDVNAVHRVWVVDDAGVPTGVIALADVLAVIAQMGMSTEEVAKQRDKMVVA